eukprot:NODE_512_length_2161_cov_31.003788_g470_i0.p1 GENE.NODE_512_length_2161_cov_31.003788_g470_i0~~NODE_512_length_2161_cov_31.003788_g470_i0.p1  ORF type:complete len:250 (+),score=23.48 NODE_512_length_2161_cov_31.003788_g470_i0:107-856(+)
MSSFRKGVSNLFIKKSLEDITAEAASSELRRVLRAPHLMALGVGAIVGVGIFVLTGQAAAKYAGPGIVLSFLLSAVGCCFSALCYAELAALVPLAGSAYTYAYVALGEWCAWIIGWDLVIEYLFGSATVAVGVHAVIKCLSRCICFSSVSGRSQGWSGYTMSLIRDIGLDLPHSLTEAPCNLPAMFVVLFITSVLSTGIEPSARLNNTLVCVKVGILIIFIFSGIAFVKRSNLEPFVPANTGEFGHFGM